MEGSLSGPWRYPWAQKLSRSPTSDRPSAHLNHHNHQNKGTPLISTHLETNTSRASSWLRRRSRHSSRESSRHPSWESSRHPCWEPSRHRHSRLVGTDNLWEAPEGPRARRERHGAPGPGRRGRREYGEPLTAADELGGREGGCGEECDEGELHVCFVGGGGMYVVGFLCCCFRCGKDKMGWKEVVPVCRRDSRIKRLVCQDVI